MSREILHIVQIHIAELERLRRLLVRLGPRRYVQAHAIINNNGCIGTHVRHLLDHYHCFFAGLPEGSIDYQARRRGNVLEHDAGAALHEMASIPFGSTDLDDGYRRLQVRLEAEASLVWSCSTVARELDYLLSHTVHHMAIIACLCRALEVDVEDEFGVSRSTLRARGSGSAVHR